MEELLSNFLKKETENPCEALEENSVNIWTNLWKLLFRILLEGSLKIFFYFWVEIYKRNFEQFLKGMLEKYPGAILRHSLMGNLEKVLAMGNFWRNFRKIFYRKSWKTNRIEFLVCTTECFSKFFGELISNSLKEFIGKLLENSWRRCWANSWKNSRKISWRSFLKTSRKNSSEK